MKSFKKELMKEFYNETMPEKSVIVNNEVSPNTLMISLRTILSLLRAIHWESHTAHWLAHGESFYSNHGMFTEIYKATEENYDEVAEKIVGIFGSNQINSHSLMELSFFWLTKINSMTDQYQRLLLLEKTLLTLIENCKEICKNLTSSGIENMLDDISDQHEKHIYFLNQTTK